MLVDTLIEIVVELIRSLVIEGLIERARNLLFKPRPRGIADVRRHVHRTTRNQLLNRLSTESGLERPLPSIFPYFTKSKKLLR